MEDWRTLLIHNLSLKLDNDGIYESKLVPILTNVDNSIGLHLAVFVEPFLSYIFDGKKTIESRFSTRKFPPYGRVNSGDILLLKQSSGPVVGLCLVSRVWFYDIDPNSWQQLQQDYAQALCATDPSFWKQRAQARYATLMQIEHVFKVDPFLFPKRDRRGWVVLNSN